MAPGQQICSVSLCSGCGRTSDISPGSHKNSTAGPRRSCYSSQWSCCWPDSPLPWHAVHRGWHCARRRLTKALARSHAGCLPPHRKAVVGGMSAGAIGQFFASPTDLVKVQMQMEGKRKLEGKPLRFRGVHHAFMKILSEGGIRGLWAGWVPNVQRAALVNMGDLTTYDSVKHFLLLNTPLVDNSLTHSVASCCSGLVAAVLGTPADVVKTRIMNQPRDKQGRGLLYKSSMDCLIQSVQGEGFMSLYKGFIPTWMRMAPWSLVFWLTYEQIRRICGVSSF
ncbi:mitochondrial uncoupling protein 4 isoform X3 [Dryobates pubescens]|uniref:mitochondrial uncoupling protein 4 isoform X3 n=1 Tax=Dryobates pubescens TaxID=118200 RepID=UPI0023B93416|nr:mitochondrial uncoupling protein 4 isoform X3 [Dryobates pubescens]